MFDSIIEILVSNPSIMAGKALLLTVGLLLSLALLLYMDRKVWAAVQMRRGPNVVGPFGLMQSLGLVKFIFKEIVIPSNSNKFLFLFAPFLTFVPALISWTVVPVAEIGMLLMLILQFYIFAVSSLGVYGIIIGGWASNSKYPFLGALRSAAQMVSYEVSLSYYYQCGSSCRLFELTDIVMDQAGSSFLSWNWLPLLPMCIVFLFLPLLKQTVLHSTFLKLSLSLLLVINWNIHQYLSCFS